jgi:putative spermidine/putrescine transport system permease protein
VDRASKERASKWALGTYFVIFTAILYLPAILMAILSFQGERGLPYFPMQGFSGHWWQSLFDETIPTSNATEIRSAALTSIYLALLVGALVSLMSLSLSMAFRRRFRGDGVLFYVIMLALMTPGFLLSLGTALFWQAIGKVPGEWPSILTEFGGLAAIGTGVVWGIPFGFLVMVAVWNRYDVRVEEASRDLGASSARTFREVTLPLIWTGLFGAFLFGFVLSWNEYDRTALLVSSGQLTLPIQIFALTVGSVIRPDLYALGTATTIFILLVVGLVLVAVALILRRRAGAADVPLEAQVKEELGEVEGLDIEGTSGPAAGGARAR